MSSCLSFGALSEVAGTSLDVRSEEDLVTALAAAIARSVCFAC